MLHFCHFLTALVTLLAFLTLFPPQRFKACFCHFQLLQSEKANNKTNKISTQHQTQRVSQWSLTPDETLGVDDLSCAVDVASTDPGGRHGEDPDEDADVATGQHHLLLRPKKKERRVK